MSRFCEPQRTINQIFTPALSAANSLFWVHDRIRMFADTDNRQRFINSLFGAGRIDGTARVMLLDLYVDECEQR